MGIPNRVDRLPVLLQWGGRAEAPAEIGARMRSAVAALGRVVAAMSAGWYDGDTAEPLDVASIRWADLVARRIAKDAFGPSPIEGYRPSLAAAPLADDIQSSRRGFRLSASVGSPMPAEPRLVSNQVAVRFGAEFAFGAVADTLADAFVGLIGAWAPDQAAVAGRSQIRQERQMDALTPRIGGLSWVSDRIGSFPEHVDGATAQAVHGGRLLIADGWPDESSLTPEAARRIWTSLTAQGWNARMTPMQQP